MRFDCVLLFWVFCATFCLYCSEVFWEGLLLWTHIRYWRILCLLFNFYQLLSSNGCQFLIGAAGLSVALGSVSNVQCRAALSRLFLPRCCAVCVSALSCVYLRLAQERVKMRTLASTVGYGNAAATRDVGLWRCCRGHTLRRNNVRTHMRCRTIIGKAI